MHMYAIYITIYIEMWLYQLFRVSVNEYSRTQEPK